MPSLRVPVDQELLDVLSDYAHSQRMSKAGAVRAWLASLPRATQPQAAAATTDAQVLPQAQGEPSTIGFSHQPDPTLQRMKARAFAELQQWQAQPPAVEPEPVAMPEPAPAREPSAFAMQLRAGAANALAQAEAIKL